MPAVRYVDHLPADFDDVHLRTDARAGLTASPKYLPPKWFYDKVGSEIFEEITKLPEYYPTCAEREILRGRAADLVELAGATTIVELGSGSSEKTRLLLGAMTARTARSGGTPRYVAVDVSGDALRAAAPALRRSFPELEITLVRADFETQLGLLPGGGHRLVAFLGSTIGNLEPASRAAFFSRLRSVLAPGEHLLLGADLVKSPGVLVPAYDDAAGVTAAFNLNVLEVLNRRLGADFDRAGFTHAVRWDTEREWIEMHLQATRPAQVTLRELGLTVGFAAGERLRTEISAKFRREGLSSELRTAGFTEVDWSTDRQGRFSLSLWQAGSTVTR